MPLFAITLRWTAKESTCDTHHCGLLAHEWPLRRQQR
jgi:hypothetical protein